METKTFSKDSFIYKFLAWPNGLWYGTPKNICDLTRQVIVKTGSILLALVVSLVYSFTLTTYLLFHIHERFGVLEFMADYTARTPIMFIGKGMAIMTVGTAIMAAIVLTISWSYDTFQNYRYKKSEAHKKFLEENPDWKPEPKRPNPLKEMYRSFKEKTCFYIKFQ